MKNNYEDYLEMSVTCGYENGCLTRFDADLLICELNEDVINTYVESVQKYFHDDMLNGDDTCMFICTGFGRSTFSGEIIFKKDLLKERGCGDLLGSIYIVCQDALDHNVPSSITYKQI